MKYCIGCRHLYYAPPDPGCQGSTYTGTYGDSDAMFACKKDHWFSEFATAVEMNSDMNSERFERAMRKAETCVDFMERAI